MSYFDRAFAITVAQEGGYSRDPADPGGETKYGISKRAYPDVNIAALTVEDAKAIYRRDYWDRLRCDDLPWPVALATFDFAVNSGVGTAAKKLQAACGAPPDGVIGPLTLARVNTMSGLKLADELFAQRITYDASLKTWPRFGLGWSRRIIALHREACR